MWLAPWSWFLPNKNLWLTSVRCLYSFGFTLFNLSVIHWLIPVGVSLANPLPAHHVLPPLLRNAFSRKLWSELEVHGLVCRLLHSASVQPDCTIELHSIDDFFIHHAFPFKATTSPRNKHLLSFKKWTCKPKPIAIGPLEHKVNALAVIRRKLVGQDHLKASAAIAWVNIVQCNMPNKILAGIFRMYRLYRLTG